MTCQEDDASAIRQQFGLIVRRIEADAFDKYEDDLLHWNDTLMVSPDCPLRKSFADLNRHTSTTNGSAERLRTLQLAKLAR